MARYALILAEARSITQRECSRHKGAWGSTHIARQDSSGFDVETGNKGGRALIRIEIEPDGEDHVVVDVTLVDAASNNWLRKLGERDGRAAARALETRLDKALRKESR